MLTFMALTVIGVGQENPRISQAVSILELQSKSSLKNLILITFWQIFKKTRRDVGNVKWAI